MMSYSHNDIDKKWQDRWSAEECFKAHVKEGMPKFYALDMFPYPSGAGLHVGHLASYTPTDVVSRYKRARGFNVLHPIGYDAFGLPAEQYAIETGVHPEKVTDEAIKNFRRQLKSFGFSFDWSREISTCKPSYYKWTQYIFKILFKKKLAYQTEAPVNWCPKLRTVLANEEVIDGKSERGGHEVVRKPMKQWMLKITDYAKQLLEDLEDLDWPKRTKQAQSHWIGKSTGAEIQFKLLNSKEDIQLQAFTTRPDTLFGVTYLVIAPEHPILSKLVTEDNKKQVSAYQKTSSHRSEVDRKTGYSKDGVFTGGYVEHPLLKTDLPIWISDYVMMDYGTGVVMAVPGHDQRDFDFAKKQKLPIKSVVVSKELPYEGDGKHENSQCEGLDIDGLYQQEACDKVIAYLEKKNLGQKKTTYKLRDWLFSRQRYWGEPFPIKRGKAGVELVEDSELPVTLPKVVDYSPSEEGESPLARAKDFVACKDARGQAAKRETDTMPGSAASSWYFLRYLDPHNEKQAFSKQAEKYWMPVDLYVGGAEHSVGHLLYSRFWHKVLYDEGLVSHKEPFKKLVHQGVILGKDGYRMSKSRGNGVNPDSVREKYGADAVRVYICFLGPLEKDKPWSEKGLEGSRRFLDRVWRFVEASKGRKDKVSASLEMCKHKTIKKVTEDIESMDFNTAISALMIFVNEIYKEDCKNENLALVLSSLLMPFAPHLAEEISYFLTEKENFVSLSPWPSYDESKIVEEECIIGVQVNGKMRGKINISPEASEEQALEQALKLKAVDKACKGKKIKKVIYKQARILNLIVG